MSKASGGSAGWAALVGLLVLVPVPVFAADTGRLLSERPPRVAAATQFEARTSTIAPSVDVPYSVVADAANAAADRFAGPRSGHTRIGCQNVGFGASLPVQVTLFRGCADFDWNVSASRNGSITVRRDGPGIAMDVPVKFTGNGTFVGDLAKAIRSGKKDFSGTFVVSISGTVRVDKSFCPEVERATAHFAWGTAPDIDIIGHTCLDAGHGLKACIGPWKFPVGGMLTDQINHSLADQVGEINKKIPCDSIRSQLQQVWKTWSIPVALTNPPVYVNIEPKSLSVPGAIVNDTAIRIVARLDAATSVSTSKAPETPPKALPENAPLATPAGQFSLAVPLAVPYPLLAAAGGWRFIGKPIKAGAAALTPTDVELFPSNDRLAVGVTVRADVRGPLHGKTGTVWFTATPGVDNNGHAIRLSNIAMTRKIDNRLWPAVSAAIATRLPHAIGTSYAYDFSGLVRDARSKLSQAIADPKNTGGVKISIAHDDLRLGRTAMLPDSFVIEGLFDADVGATLQSPHP